MLVLYYDKIIYSDHLFYGLQSNRVSYISFTNNSH